MWTVLYTALLTMLVLVTVHHLYNYLTTTLTTPILHDDIAFRAKKLAEIKDPPLEDILEHFKKA